MGNGILYKIYMGGTYERKIVWSIPGLSPDKDVYPEDIHGGRGMGVGGFLRTRGGSYEEGDRKSDVLFDGLGHK